jgi:hypothetical protein
MTFTPNGGAYWQNQINTAAQSSRRSVTITGNWEIERTIVIPSDFTLFLEDCHLRMAEGTFCNLFTNAARDATPRTLANADKNIRILGRGRAILDGGVYNGLSERNSGADGRPHISVNNLILFVNVDGFTISGLHLRHQRWWAMNFIHCRNGAIRQMDFCSHDGIADPNGNLIPGKTLRHIAQFPGHHAYIRNSDGIDLRSGCHDILIEDITGFTQDDTVALTGLFGSTESLYRVEDDTTDIYNVIIRNVNSASPCSNVRLLNQGGVKLYNILVDGVMDASAGSPHMTQGIYAVRVGDNRLYGERHSAPEETRNITIRNVYSRAKVAVSLAGAITDLTLDTIRGFDTCQTLIQNDATLHSSDEQ